MWGCVFGTAIKMALGMPAFLIRVPRFESWLYFQLQLPANVHLGRQQVMAQVVESLLPTWETQTEFLAPDFGLVQS